MRNNILSLIFMALMFCGCERYEDNLPYTVYTIKKGAHSSKSRLRWLYQPHLSYEVIFDNSCVYENEIPSNQRDINKLFGFSDCNSHHQENSARFGWRWYNEQLEVLSYCYARGVRTSTHIANLQLNTPYKCHIYLYPDRYELEIEGFALVQEIRVDVCKQGAYYLLWPYFGGDETAPHTIRIHMRKLI